MRTLILAGAACAVAGCATMKTPAATPVARLPFCMPCEQPCVSDQPCGPKAAPVVFKDRKLELREKIYFDTDMATIQPRSFGILDAVASALQARPDVQRVAIEGHTDSLGSERTNTSLSQARAESVRQYLIDKGVAASRLTAKGFGPTRPIADNATAEGREKNRRVEFHIGD